MGIVNMVKTIKEIHPTYIIFVEIGSFFYVYGKDSYIMSYLFSYQLKKISNVSSCAFPKGSLNKVMATLENKKINYIIVDRRNNYEVVQELNNGNLNKYEEIFEKARIEINYNIRVENIVQYLMENRNTKLLLEMERLIVEGRKV